MAAERADLAGYADEVDAALAAVEGLGIDADHAGMLIVPVTVEAPERGAPYRPSATWQRLSKFSLVNLLIALAVAAVLGGVAGVVVLKGTPSYESSSVIEMFQPRIFTDSGPGGVTKLNGLRTRYAALARTQAVLGPVAQKVGVPVGTVTRSVNVLVSGTSLLMLPTARTDKAELSRQLADAMADQLSAFAAAEQNAEQIPAGEQVQLRIAQRAGPGVKVSPERNRALSAAGVTAVVVLGLVYVLLQLTGTRRRQRD